ncbi:hypothetical protein ACQY0O_007887 [Thecaphora frezii]
MLSAVASAARIRSVLDRWRRIRDLAGIRALVQRDDSDAYTCMELDGGAGLRGSSSRQPDEERCFVGRWRHRRSSDGTEASGRSLRLKPAWLLLGQCTSRHMPALPASSSTSTVMGGTLAMLAGLVRTKRWHPRWGSPIRVSDRPRRLHGPAAHPPIQRGGGHRRSYSHARASPGNGAARSAVLGIGIDVLYLPRLRALMARQAQRAAGASTSTPKRVATAADRLASRILCCSELSEWEVLKAASRSRSHDRGSGGGDGDGEQLDAALVRFLAVRWCAKEAAYKALYPVHVVSWKDLCLEKPLSSGVEANAELQEQERSGMRSRKPQLRLSDEWRARIALVATDAVPELHFSASHDGDYVVANVLALRGGGDGFDAGVWEQTSIPPLATAAARDGSTRPSSKLADALLADELDDDCAGAATADPRRQHVDQPHPA